MLTDMQRTAFRRRGVCAIEGAITPDRLADLRDAADALVNAAQAGNPIPPAFLRDGQSYAISKTDRLFFSNRAEAFPAMASFVRSELVATIAQELIGPDVFLFNEQIVVKAPRHGSRFDWHQDSGYLSFVHRPYLTLWCALDDATRENGTIYVIPRDLDRDQTISPHDFDAEGANLVGYDGAEEGEVIEASAGTILAFSSLTLHRTGPNTTDWPRRAYVCQYSPEPIVNPATGRPHNRAERLRTNAAA